jgi:hypothetical protein
MIRNRRAGLGPVELEAVLTSLLEAKGRLHQACVDRLEGPPEGGLADARVLARVVSGLRGDPPQRRSKFAVLREIPL